MPFSVPANLPWTWVNLYLLGLYLPFHIRLVAHSYPSEQAILSMWVFLPPCFCHSQVSNVIFQWLIFNCLCLYFVYSISNSVIQLLLIDVLILLCITKAFVLSKFLSDTPTAVPVINKTRLAQDWPCLAFLLPTELPVLGFSSSAFAIHTNPHLLNFNY